MPVGPTDEMDCDTEEMDEVGAPTWPEVEGIGGAGDGTPVLDVLGTLPAVPTW